ncbi:acyltransferase family protein [Massilia sp. UBA6681]|uniref:acyltransferase family protein n=1 Tax=Massilia sp. UBA6681 TaxID=1946839 RepID=UPI0025C5AF4F|nr:acyltransferase [Massilia sp. UBA6681]
METNRINHIDVWRFIAISMVIICHIVAFSHPWYSEVAPGIIWRLKLFGTVGVQVFFCISGFVICRGMVRESLSTGRVNISAFYLRRAYRILPPLAVYILCIALLSAAGFFDLPLSSFVRASAFLCNFDVKSCGWELGHTWSLAFEEQFYLLFPLFFIASHLVEHRQRILSATLLLVGIMLAARLWGIPEIGDYIAFFIFMLAGCVCALYWEWLEPRLQALPFSVWLATVLLVLASSLFIFPEPAEQFMRPVLMPMLICVAVFGTPTRRPTIRRLFSDPHFAYLGRISYGIYLWQQLATADYGFSSPLYGLLLVIAAVVLSHYSFVHFEMPLIRRGSELPKASPTRLDAPRTGDESDTLSNRSI